MGNIFNVLWDRVIAVKDDPAPVIKNEIKAPPPLKESAVISMPIASAEAPQSTKTEKTVEDYIHELTKHLGKAGGIEMTCTSWSGFSDINIIATIPVKYYERAEYALNQMHNATSELKNLLGIDVQLSPQLVIHPDGGRGLAVYFPSWNLRLMHLYVESLIDLNKSNSHKLEFDLRTSLMEAGKMLFRKRRIA